MPQHYMAQLTSKKAKKVLEHGEVKGHMLSEKQKKLFGMIAGGGKPKVMMSKMAGKLRKK